MKTSAKEIPKQDKPTSMVAAPGANAETIHSAQRPPDSAFSGKWRNIKDGYVYKHATAPHPNGKTHKGLIERQEKNEGNGEVTLIHAGLYWEGTEDEWFATFRKE